MGNLRTGIPKMDELLGGGIPQDSSILITGPLGADVESFGQQIAATAACEFPCVYLVSDKTPSLVKEKLSSMKRLPEKNLHFVDCFSLTIGMSAEEKFSLKSPLEIAGAMDELSGKFGTKLFVFDSASSGFFREAKSPEELNDFLGSISQKAKSLGACAVFLFSQFSEEDERAVSELSKSMHAVVSISSVEENFVERSFYTISLKEDIHIPFKVSAEGVSLYVPKIIVTGPYHSGKSTFIHKISTKAVSVDRLGTTVALDHGHVEYRGFSVDLFGTPGQEAFNFILPVIARDTFGVILVIDSTDVNSFQRAREMIDIVSGGRIPFVVAANKSDLSGSMPVKDVRLHLAIGERVPVIRTVSTTGEGIFECLVALFDMITGFSMERKGGAE